MRYRSWSREAFSLVTKMKPPLRAIAILVLSIGLVAVVLGTALAHTGPLPVIAGQSHATNDCTGLISYRGHTSYATEGEHVVINMDGAKVADIPLDTSATFDGADVGYSPDTKHVVVFTLWAGDQQSNLVTIGVSRVYGCEPITNPRAIIHAPTCRGEVGEVVVMLDNSASRDGKLGPGTAQFVTTIDREVFGSDPRTLGAGVVKDVTLPIANGSVVRVFAYEDGKHVLLAKARENLELCLPPPVAITPLAGPTCDRFFIRVKVANTTGHAVQIRFLINGKTFFETVKADATVIGTFPTGGPGISMEVADMTDHAIVFRGDGPELSCQTPSSPAATTTPPPPPAHHRRPSGAASTGSDATPIAAAAVLGILLVGLGLMYLARRVYLERRMSG